MRKLFFVATLLALLLMPAFGQTKPSGKKEDTKAASKAALIDINSASEADVLNKALEIEGIISNFYAEAAEQSKSLMADVPRDFMHLVKKRSRRIEHLKKLG